MAGLPGRLPPPLTKGKTQPSPSRGFTSCRGRAVRPKEGLPARMAIANAVTKKKCKRQLQVRASFAYEQEEAHSR